jgi:excisionase family DNA binding protein
MDWISTMLENASTPIQAGAMPPISNRITVPDIAVRLHIGRQAVYRMLEQHIIPAIRLGKRWIITRYAYEQWERSAGMTSEHPPSVQ